MSDAHQDDQELRAENERLATEIRARGGIVERLSELDPTLAGLFLRQILADEDQSVLPLRFLIPDFDTLPRPEEMDEIHLAYRLDQIERTLTRYGMLLELQPGVPPAVAYRFLIDDFIPTSVVPDQRSDDCIMHIDGCSGCCDEPCFQRDYCEHYREEEQVGVDSDERNHGGPPPTTQGLSS